ncbi:unnamed protein product [Callosobruchus maculatus]|uniref:Uncharacterized protein n=1 Tax=Callosobruchus maculatus TaxID=64391 RepID=A0A653BV35_CALMS|nr:unnamed protein product [Callosobruchus maculatus]
MRPVSTIKDRKTPVTCSKCRKPICKQHAQQRFVCNACTTASEMWSDESEETIIRLVKITISV